MHSSADKALLMDALCERLYSETATIYELIWSGNT
jgi:phage tail protein X